MKNTTAGPEEASYTKQTSTTKRNVTHVSVCLASIERVARTSSTTWEAKTNDDIVAEDFGTVIHNCIHISSLASF